LVAPGVHFESASTGPTLVAGGAAGKVSGPAVDDPRNEVMTVGPAPVGRTGDEVLGDEVDVQPAMHAATTTTAAVPARDLSTVERYGGGVTLQGTAL
jgi:hypothetical protein